MKIKNELAKSKDVYYAPSLAPKRPANCLFDIFRFTPASPVSWVSAGEEYGMSSSSLTLAFPFSLLLFFRGGPGDAISPKRGATLHGLHSWSRPAGTSHKRRAVPHSRVPLLCSSCLPVQS